jgi:hypothetical protein
LFVWRWDQNAVDALLHALQSPQRSVLRLCLCRESNPGYWNLEMVHKPNNELVFQNYRLPICF